MIRRKFYIKKQKFTVRITKEGNDYVSICEETGTTDYGRSIKTAIANLKEGTKDYLIAFPHKNPYN